MIKRLLFFSLLVFTLFSIDRVFAQGSVPQIVVDGNPIYAYDNFAIKNGTVYISPQKAAELFSLTFGSDEYGVVYTFSTQVRVLTYDTKSGSLNCGDRRSFAYEVVDGQYPAYYTDTGAFVPLRMLCTYMDISIDYISDEHLVEIRQKPYHTGIYNADGIAVSYAGGKYGLVNSLGYQLLSNSYDDISNYENPSFFKIVQNGKCGFTNKDGKVVCDIIYDEISYKASNEIYIHLGDKIGMCDVSGYVILPPMYDDIVYAGNLIAMVKTDDRWTLIDCVENRTFGLKYDEVYKITEGIQTDNGYIKGYYCMRNGKWGCVDSFGNTVIELKYDSLDKFDSKGRARAIYRGKFMLIDCGGKVIIPPGYDYLYPFDSLNVAVAQIGKKYGAIDFNGTPVIPFEYDYIYSFNNSPTTVAYKDNRFFIISTQGEVIGDRSFSYMEEFKNGMSLAYSEGYGYVDHYANEIIPCEHSDVKQGTTFSVFLKKDDKWALFDPNGVNLTGYIYNDAGGFENGLSPVSIKGDSGVLYGYVNDSGDTIIPFIYSSAQKFKYGKAIVSLNRAYGIIDIDGNTVIPFEYTGFNPSYDYNVIAAADNNKKWGLISFLNNRLTDFEYDYIFEFEGGYASVLKKHKYGIIDTEGNLVVDTIYKNASLAKEALNKLK